ncbi:MAG: hypothetical protein HQM10_15365 [Candidatus Riflebacteria bacterium]|nr:hypothetical protein [Candidatus Riflebacteria bacterium]
MRKVPIIRFLVLFAFILSFAPALFSQPASTGKLFVDFLAMKIYLPTAISGPTAFREDTTVSFQGIGKKFYEATPQTTFTLWYEWGDGYTTNVDNPLSNTFNSFSHSWWDSGIYTIRLKIKYSKRTWKGINAVDTPNTIEEVANLTIVTTVHDVAPAGTIYFSVLRTLGSTVDEDVSSTFTAGVMIDYVKEIPENVKTADHYDGVATNSVEYRWKITRPTGCVEYEDPSWTRIAGNGTTVNPLVYTFSTPFEPASYTVTLQVRYLEHRWSKVYNGSNAIGWAYDKTYMSNSVVKYCQNVPLGKPAKDSAANLMLSGQTPFEIMVADTTEATAVIESGPSTGTTGDPLENYMVTMSVTDNNPNAEYSDCVLVEDLYQQGAKSVRKDQEDTSATAVGSVIRALSATSKQVLDPVTSAVITGSRARYKFEFGRSYSYKDKLPDDYAYTMDNYGPSKSNDELKYYCKVNVKDGYDKSVPGKYLVKTSSRNVTVADNDAPAFTMRMKTDPEALFVVERGVNDKPGLPAPIDITLMGIKIKDQTDPFKLAKPDKIDVVSEKYFPLVYVGQRVFVQITGNDNVNGNDLTSGFAYTLDGVPVSLSGSFFMIEKLPVENPVTCTFFANDKQGNSRAIQFKIKVQELGFTPRILENKIKGGK